MSNRETYNKCALVFTISFYENEAVIKSLQASQDFILGLDYLLVKFIYLGVIKTF